MKILMRKFKAVEATYEALIKQYESARISSENDVSSIQVLQKAVVPEIKSGPKRVKFVISALLMSLFASCGLAFALDYFKNMPDEHKSLCRSLLKLSH